MINTVSFREHTVVVPLYPSPLVSLFFSCLKKIITIFIHIVRKCSNRSQTSKSTFVLTVKLTFVRRISAFSATNEYVYPVISEVYLSVLRRVFRIFLDNVHRSDELRISICYTWWLSLERLHCTLF